MLINTNKFKYETLNRVTQDSGYRTYNTAGSDPLPSVTTILSATSDMTAIDNWRQRIGEKEAAYIVNLSSSIGTAMHDNLENWIRGNPLPKGTALVRKTARELAQVIIDKGLCNVDEIWGLEEHLYYPGLYAGTADVIGIWKGEPAIIDFKNTRKPKKLEWVQSYCKQLTAYAMAHNEVYGTNITKGVIMMVAREPECFGEYQEFEIDIADHIDSWLQTLEDYYK